MGGSHDSAFCISAMSLGAWGLAHFGMSPFMGPHPSLTDSDRLPALPEHHGAPSVWLAQICCPLLSHSQGMCRPKGDPYRCPCLPPLPATPLLPQSQNFPWCSPDFSFFLWLSGTLCRSCELLFGVSSIPSPILCLSATSFPFQDDLLDIQLLLNSTEASLHQLTALLDCRGLHKVLWRFCGGRRRMWKARGWLMACAG